MVQAVTEHTIAILREEKNKWERRCSLTPKEVKEIVAKGIRVLVQPSDNRCFSEDEFIEAGAIIQEDVTEATVIFGVKEVPMANLLPGKTYFFFSHTIKAQDYNMPLLDVFLEKKIRMVDFECIREPKKEGVIPQRLVAFGRYAGIAGAFDFLRGIGEFLLQKKFQTPFLIGSSYMYPDYNAMQYALKLLSDSILAGGIPKKLAPVVFAVTGTGRVSDGSVEILEQLPHVKVEASNLRAYLADPANASNSKQIVICQMGSKDIVKRKDGTAYTRADYHEFPEKYEGIFEEYLDLVTWLVNGIYWEAKYPRVLSTEGLKKAQLAGKCRLLGLTDISADADGSVEFTSRFTSIEEPFLLYNAHTNEFKEKMEQLDENDILFHSVDHLPAEMPKEASNHFGSQLLPFVERVVKSDFSKPFDQQTDLPEEIKNAVITAHGELTPDYAYIAKLREANEMVAAKSEGGDSQSGLQGFTVMLSGHLFDTQAFNKCIDACEKNGIAFRVLEWEIGNNNSQQTRVVIQGMSTNEQALEAAQTDLKNICDSENIKVQPASGPSYDKKVLSMINKDHSH